MVGGALTPLQRRQNLVAVTAAMTVTALIYGLSLPLLSLVMDQRGIDSELIGLSAGVQSLGIVLVAPFLPAYVRRSGLAAPMIGAILVSLVGFLLLPVFPSVQAWFVLRFAIGTAGGVLWVCGDAWVNEVATENIRGRVVAVYGVAVAGGFSLGPMVLSLTGSHTIAPFLVSSAIMLLSTLPLLLVIRIAPSMHGELIGGLHRYFAIAPLPMLMCILFAISEAILLTFAPLYGIERGLSEAQALYLITFMGIGGMLGQWPIGWLADHMDRLLLASFSILCVVAFAIALPIAIATPGWNLFFMLLLGGANFAIYSIGMVIIGERFKGADLAAASALYGLMFGVGSVVGPSLGGFAMETLRPHGVPIAIAFMYAAFLPATVVAQRRERRRRAAAAASCR